MSSQAGLDLWRVCMLPVSRTTLIDPVCFLVLKILVQGHGAYRTSQAVLNHSVGILACQYVHCSILEVG